MKPIQNLRLRSVGDNSDVPVITIDPATTAAQLLECYKLFLGIPRNHQFVLVRPAIVTPILPEATLGELDIRDGELLYVEQSFIGPAATRRDLADEQAHHDDLLRIATAALRVLERQAATFGSFIPAHIQIELDTVRAQIAQSQMAIELLAHWLDGCAEQAYEEVCITK